MFKERIIFKVAHNFVAIVDCVEIAQGRVKKRFQVIFLFPLRDGLDNLIKMQVNKKVGHLRCLSRIFCSCKENALERHSEYSPQKQSALSKRGSRLLHGSNQHKSFLYRLTDRYNMLRCSVSKLIHSRGVVIQSVLHTAFAPSHPAGPRKLHFST